MPTYNAVEFDPRIHKEPEPEGKEVDSVTVDGKVFRKGQHVRDWYMNDEVLVVQSIMELQDGTCRINLADPATNQKVTHYDSSQLDEVARLSLV